MLKLNAVFWSTHNPKSLGAIFEKLGFQTSISKRYPENLTIDFGSESIELVDLSNQSAKNNSIIGATSDREGITGVQLESDDILNDYREYKKQKIELESPKMAQATSSSSEGKQLPRWYGFHLPNNLTLKLKAWIVMGSPEYYKEQESRILPLKHSNSCFGIEGLALNVSNPEVFSTSWSKLTFRPKSKVTWNEIIKCDGYRVLSGEKFIDALPKEANSASDGQAFMLTLKVTDLEHAKELCKKAGFKTSTCHSRDGFLVDDSNLKNQMSGITIRFVRAAWKKYLAPTNSIIPFYRHEDKFRPLGGTNTSTLQDGFEDNWKY